MKEEEKKIIKREKHPGRVAQGHELAALMKKRKEEILHNKKQSIEQQPVKQPTRSPEQSAARSNDTFVYGAGTLAVLAIGVSSLKIKKTLSSLKIKEKQDQRPKRSHIL